MAIKITTNTRTLILFNIYNHNNHNQSIDTLANEWDMNENAWTSDPATEIIVLGDFNRHHSTGKPCTTATSRDRIDYSTHYCTL